jgi:hypothetical protein
VKKLNYIFIILLLSTLSCRKYEIKKGESLKKYQGKWIRFGNTHDPSNRDVNISIAYLKADKGYLSRSFFQENVYNASSLSDLEMGETDTRFEVKGDTLLIEEFVRLKKNTIHNHHIIFPPVFIDSTVVINQGTDSVIVDHYMDVQPFFNTTGLTKRWYKIKE